MGGDHTIGGGGYRHGDAAPYMDGCGRSLQDELMKAVEEQGVTKEEVAEAPESHGCFCKFGVQLKDWEGPLLIMMRYIFEFCDTVASLVWVSFLWMS